jgi:hypothetical protein
MDELDLMGITCSILVVIGFALVWGKDKGGKKTGEWIIVIAFILMIILTILRFNRSN